MNTPPRTFPEANQWFYSTFKLDELNFEDVNYTKLVQKALHDGWMKDSKPQFDLKDAKRAIIKNRVRFLFEFKRHWVGRNVDVLYFDSSRKFTSRGGGSESFYGERWLSLLRKSNVNFGVRSELISDRKLGGQIHRELGILNSLMAHVALVLGAEHPLLNHLSAICLNYLLSYGRAAGLLSELKPQRILLTCHYGKEGLIRAARQAGVKVIELQHGIIDENDIFYCYPKAIRGVRKLALFPDSIYTYGNYWSDLLSQYHEFAHIVTVGDYTYRLPTQTKEQQNRVLITTQTGMVDDYLQIIKWIAQQVAQYPEWTIVVRHHPLENNTTLSKYRDLCNNFPFITESVGTSLSEDFQESKVHVSIYSTTLFDACRWPVHNYSVQNFGSASMYAASILKTGIAEGIEFGASIPLEQADTTRESQSSFGKPDYFYSEFPTSDVLKELSKWSV